MFQDLLQLNTLSAISLWQPWSTLAAMGAKKYETRHWYTPHRGLLVIHAAKRWTQEQIDYCWQEPFRTTLKGLGFVALEQIPRGALLGVVNLTAVYKTENVTVSETEWAFGNYSPGRYAWKLEGARPFPKPIPYRGRQGFFNVPVNDIRPYLETMETVS